MNNEDKIIAYLQGDLDQDSALALETLLTDDPELQQMMDDYRILYGVIDELETEVPSVEMKARFDKYMSEVSSTDQSATIVPLMSRAWIRVASVAAVLAIGILVGINYSQQSLIERLDRQNYALQNEMMESLKSPSITGRIQAVNVSNGITQPNKEVIDVLIQTMSDDESSHVRLAAVEALTEYTDLSDVRVAMIRRLSTEEDPIVLITLIGALTQDADESVIAPLTRLTESNIDKSVKDEAHVGLMKIQKI